MTSYALTHVSPMYPGCSAALLYERVSDIAHTCRKMR